MNHQTHYLIPRRTSRREYVCNFFEFRAACDQLIAPLELSNPKSDAEEIQIKHDLVALSFRSLNLFIKPIIQMPRSFYHL